MENNLEEELTKEEKEKLEKFKSFMKNYTIEEFAEANSNYNLLKYDDQVKFIKYLLKNEGPESINYGFFFPLDSNTIDECKWEALSTVSKRIKGLYEQNNTIIELLKWKKTD
jgi:hypothetical protein